MIDFNDIITFDRVLQHFPNQATKMEAFLAQRDLMMPNGKIYKRPTSRTVITGMADYSVTEEIYQALKHTNDVWYTTNKQTPNVHGFPLGVCEMTPLLPLWKAMNAPKETRNLVYMNFTMETNPIERQRVWDAFKDKSWVTAELGVSQERFFDQVHNHRFVICPRGYGIDTFRMWESIYLGSIPIVKHNFVHSDWMDLPILFVNEWSEITPELLESVDMSTRSIEKAKLSYWIRQIKRSQPLRPIRYA